MYNHPVRLAGKGREVGPYSGSKSGLRASRGLSSPFSRSTSVIFQRMIINPPARTAPVIYNTPKPKPPPIGIELGAALSVGLESSTLGLSVRSFPLLELLVGAGPYALVMVVVSWSNAVGAVTMTLTVLAAAEAVVAYVVLEKLHRYMISLISALVLVNNSPIQIVRLTLKIVFIIVIVVVVIVIVIIIAIVVVVVVVVRSHPLRHAVCAES